MKNTLQILIFFLFLCILNINAQSKYSYYYKGQKVYLTLDKNHLNIFTNENFQSASISNLNFKNFNLAKDNSVNHNQSFAKIEFQSEPTDLEFLLKIDSLKQNLNINHVSLFFKRTNSTSVGISNIFYIKLKNANDYGVLAKVANLKNVAIINQVPYMPEWYVLSVKKNTIGSTLDLTNYFYETGLFADVDPAFMFNFNNSCTNDDDFGSLWGLNNSANPNIDINACQAWNISQGNGVKVAVLDQGIHTIHNDLAGNMLPLSFDTQTGTSPSVFNGASHGTHVAGTIAAIKDNNLQVVGVAPLSKIMAVSHSLSSTPNISAELASGISWAYQNGADVINNSWGDQGGQLYNQLYSPILENAILSAMTFGRDNKGTLVVFASGNYGVNSPIMDYPATFNDNIVTVGSITNVGQRSIFNSTRGSGYGTKLDIVAPGSNIFSTIPDNQVGNSSGTSMASPHISGVCALILSANPCLTGQQVRDIIEQTAQKVGGYSYATTVGRPNGTWNNQMGYGLVDAFAAVLMAQSMVGSVQIAGLDAFCTSGTYSAAGGATTYNWTITQGANLVTITGNGTSTVTLTAQPNVSGQVTLSLTLGGTCGDLTTNKTITVGVPQFNSFTFGNEFLIPACFSSSCLTTGLQSAVINASFTGMSASEISDDSNWEWVSNNNLIFLNSLENRTQVCPIAIGSSNFKVRAKNACGWSDWVDYQLFDITDCPFNFRTSTIYTIYPNPSNDTVNIELKDSKIKPEKEAIVSGTLFDLMGQSRGKVEIKNNSASLSVAGLKKGIYVLNINIDGKVEGHQVIVE